MGADVGEIICEMSRRLSSWNNRTTRVKDEFVCMSRERSQRDGERTLMGCLTIIFSS